MAPQPSFQKAAVLIVLLTLPACEPSPPPELPTGPTLTSLHQGVGAFPNIVGLQRSEARSVLKEADVYFRVALVRCREEKRRLVVRTIPLPGQSEPFNMAEVYVATPICHTPRILLRDVDLALVRLESKGFRWRIIERHHPSLQPGTVFRVLPYQRTFDSIHHTIRLVVAAEPREWTTASQPG